MTTTAADTTTITGHTVHLPAADFRQALQSALLFIDKNGVDAHRHVCLHLPKDAAHLTVNAMDGHGFYQQRLELVTVQDEDSARTAASLPEGSYAWSGTGQLMIPVNAAANLVKAIPAKSKGYITLHVTSQQRTTAMPHSQNACCVLPYGDSVSFGTNEYEYPGYSPFVERAVGNKDKAQTIQGRAFPITEFTRIAKALPEKFFKVYWGDERNSPCLVEQGENISIVFMPSGWIDDAEYKDVA